MNKRIFALIVALTISTAPVHAYYHTVQRQPTIANKVAGYALKTLACLHVLGGSWLTLQTPFNPSNGTRTEVVSFADGTRTILHDMPLVMGAFMMLIGGGLNLWGETELHPMPEHHYSCDQESCQTPQTNNQVAQAA